MNVYRDVDVGEASAAPPLPEVVVVVEMVTPTRPLSLNTSALRLVPAASLAGRSLALALTSLTLGVATPSTASSLADAGAAGVAVAVAAAVDGVVDDGVGVGGGGGGADAGVVGGVATPARTARAMRGPAAAAAARTPGVDSSAALFGDGSSED